MFFNKPKNNVIIQAGTPIAILNEKTAIYEASINPIKTIKVSFKDLIDITYALNVKNIFLNKNRLFSSKPSIILDIEKQIIKRELTKYRERPVKPQVNDISLFVDFLEKAVDEEGFLITMVE